MKLLCKRILSGLLVLGLGLSGVSLQANATALSPKNANAAYGKSVAFYCAAVFTGEDGNTYVSGVISYSLGYYLENQANGTKMPEFAQATGVYAYYAKTLFNT